MSKSKEIYLQKCMLKKTALMFFFLCLSSFFLVAQTNSPTPVPATAPTSIPTDSLPAASKSPESTVTQTPPSATNDPAQTLSPPPPSITNDSTKAVAVPSSSSPVAIPVETAKPTPAFTKKIFHAEFIKKDVELKKGEIVSNVLRVVNASDKTVSFYIDISHPLKWKTLTNTTKLYETKPGDTLFIPVRVIPATEFKGNMSYLINVFITNEDGKQLTSDLFFASTQKVVKWELTVLPRERIYFLNNENTTTFGINLFNAGNENQDILLTLSDIGRNVIISDTAGKIITKKFFDLNLAPERDTTMQFKMGYFEGRRNYKVVDNETYIPRSSTEESKYTVFAKSTESKQASKNVFTTGKKIDFVKLSNQKKMNPYGNSVIPLIADANIYNILGTQPMMNLVLKGNTILSNGANLIYFTQLNYTAYSFDNEFFKRNNSWFIGYYDKKGDIQIGSVASTGSIGLTTSGKGISGHYYINSKQTVGAFFTRSPTIFGQADRTSFGASHRYVFTTRRQLLTSIGHIENTRAKNATDYIGGRYTMSLTNKHQIGCGATLTRNVNTFTPGVRKEALGYMVNANYSGMFFKSKLATNLRGGYNSKNFASGYSDRLILTHRSVYQASKKWTLILQNSFNRFESPFYSNGVVAPITNTILNNQLYLANNGTEQKFMPNIFYNISDVYGVKLHFRGVGVDYNYFNFNKNFRFSTSVKGGYNNLITYPNIKEYFTFQLFSICQYQNVSFNVRYNYGPQSARVIDSTLGYRYPQLLYLSLLHQYVFRDPRFVLQTSGNYSYSNVSYSHSFGVYPEMYFFSYDGWRFKLTFGYNVNVSNRGKAGLYDPSTPALQRTGDENLNPQVNQNFTMGAGIRKEFGIPIPKKFAKERFSTTQFVAFLDVNGNRIRDNEEIVLDNVVIRLNDAEVLTNELGTAKFINIKQGNYLLSVIQLEDYKGWFPLKPDSVTIDEGAQKLFVPFVRGIKLSGNIVLDREKYAADANEQMDLSKIRISVSDSTGKTLSTLTDAKGGYTLYVPSGNYVLTMDDAVLGERFALAQNNIEVELKIGMEGFFYTFYIVEKKRKINMRKSGN
jgi:hypothetical protein